MWDRRYEETLSIKEILENILARLEAEYYPDVKELEKELAKRD